MKVHVLVRADRTAGGDEQLGVDSVYTDRADAGVALRALWASGQAGGIEERELTPSSEGAALIDRAWLSTLKGWRPAFRAGDSPELIEDSAWWFGPQPYVAVRFLDEDGRPWLCVGTASAGWCEVACPATRNDLRQLAAAMNYPL
jgi:hypothetical protein